MRYISAIVLGLIFAASPQGAVAETVRVLGYIGSHKKEVKAHIVTDRQTFPLQGRPDYLAITEVYPDFVKPVTCEYTVTAQGIHPYERSFRSVGFGELTYFIRASGCDCDGVQVVNRSSSRPSQPVLISSVTGVTKAELEKLLAGDSFTISGLVPSRPKQERARLAQLLADNIAPVPDFGIRVGFGSEVRYANREPKQVEDEVADCAEIAKRVKLPALLGLTSWWSGTPVSVDDGVGGKFGDIQYQQACYSPDSVNPENAELKKLLGNRYDPHYRLSIPNHWSNCPWLTMNSPRLNAYRHRRLDEAVGILKSLTSEDAGWLSGIYLENEPRYWDTHCEAKIGETDPPRLWADFNPLAVEDARNDGVTLDPSDGLSNEELSWLHRNVGRYMQDTTSAYIQSAKAHSMDVGLPLYTHSLQKRDMFPGAEINHPASEWAYAEGARAGIEGMFAMPSDYYRVREWGKWANVNREENDGMSIDLHLWDLRVSYALGADLYNSYNWDSIGAERFFAYVKEFTSNLPVASSTPAQVGSLDRYTFKMKTSHKLQAFSGVEMPVKVGQAFKGSASLGIVFPDGRTISSECTDLDLRVGDHTVVFDFTTPAECGWDQEVLVVLYAFDEDGRIALDSIELNSEAANSIKMLLDLRTQRALSLWSIARAEAKKQRCYLE